jgi:electron transfer flavoprotein alpha subunit
MVESLYGVKEETENILVYIEHFGEEIESVSLEMLSKGRELADQVGWELVGLLLGRDVGKYLDVVFTHGADKVILVEHSLLDHFTVDAYSHTVFQVIESHRPSIFLLGATTNGRDLAGRLAVRLKTGLNADCTDLRIDPDIGVLVCEVSGFGSGILALIDIPNHRPQMATVRPGVFDIKESAGVKQGDVVDFEVKLSTDIIRTRIVKQVLGKHVNLSNVPILIAGGRGVSGDFIILKKLAELLGGEVGATRPPVDDGYIERERQIGQTGIVCSPIIAICCGISGAFHFVVGIEKADIVVSINSDPDAPIFEFSDYCIIGDVDTILTALIDEVVQFKEVIHG